ncbi:HNH endonuclease [Kocuria sp. U4B]
MPARTHREPYEPNEAEELSFYYAQARTVRGTTPPDDPARHAGDLVARIIADRRDSIDPPYTYYELATPLVIEGKPVSQRALRFFLGRRGYEQLPPSQKPYKGTSTNPRHRTATHYACGHERIPENTWRTSRGLDICKFCQNEANRRSRELRRLRQTGIDPEKDVATELETQDVTLNAEMLGQMGRTLTEMAAVVAEGGTEVEQDALDDLFTQLQEMDPEHGASEGRQRATLHLLRERNPKLRRDKLESVRRSGNPIVCEVCGFDFGEVYGDRGKGYIEVHHATPLHVTGPVTTKLADLVLLCANCHRMIHCGPQWLPVDELRSRVQAARVNNVMPHNNQE